jgi:predicted ATPase
VEISMARTGVADSAGDVLWPPPPAVAADSAMARYARYVRRTRDADTADYERLWAVKRLIQGVPLAQAVSAGVVDRPDVLKFFAGLGRRKRAATRGTR